MDIQYILGKIFTIWMCDCFHSLCFFSCLNYLLNFVLFYLQFLLHRRMAFHKKSIGQILSNKCVMPVCVCVHLFMCGRSMDSLCYVLLAYSMSTVKKQIKNLLSMNSELILNWFNLHHGNFTRHFVTQSRLSFHKSFRFCRWNSIALHVIASLPRMIAVEQFHYHCSADVTAIRIQIWINRLATNDLFIARTTIVMYYYCCQLQMQTNRFQSIVFARDQWLFWRRLRIFFQIYWKFNFRLVKRPIT